MTMEQFFLLRSEQGQQILKALAQESLADAEVLPVIERYRKRYPTELVAAAVELMQLRQRAAGKFARAGVMFFTRDGLEMASSDEVARHTARRFSGLRQVFDLCCGIGGDALALADYAARVVAVDRDEVHLEMARANAQALSYDHTMEFVRADVTEFMQQAPLLIGRPDAVFIDPSRREARAAAKQPESYSPPLSWCLSLTQSTPKAGIKVSPALDYEALLAGMSAEVEIISLKGECKEAMLWLGEFRTCDRRATVLPGGESLTDKGPTSDALGDIDAWLYEPDNAVVRAHLIQRLAGEYGLWRIDPEIAYLCGDREVVSPFLTGYRVKEAFPWNLKRLNAALREMHIGKVTIKKRGFPLTPEALLPKLKLTGSAQATLICTRLQGEPMVIIADYR